MGVDCVHCSHAARIFLTANVCINSDPRRGRSAHRDLAPGLCPFNAIVHAAKAGQNLVCHFSHRGTLVGCRHDDQGSIRPDCFWIRSQYQGVHPDRTLCAECACSSYRAFTHCIQPASQTHCLCDWLSCALSISCSDRGCDVDLGTKWNSGNDLDKQSLCTNTHWEFAHAVPPSTHDCDSHNHAFDRCSPRDVKRRS